MHIAPPVPVLEIARRLEASGFEAWCVGGAVRDALLGQPNLDWDLATSATPDQVRNIFGGRRTIPIGVDFGTVGVIDSENRMHEVTTFRRDVATDGRHAVVEFGASLDDDLARRDFTINALAYSPSRQELRDPYQGAEDLRRRVIRAVGEPEARMREDRLRALRAIRFAARLGFLIDPATYRAIEASAPHLGRLSRERVKQELDKTMEQVRQPAGALAIWSQSGALAALIPQFARINISAFVFLDFLCLPGPPGRPNRRMLRLAGMMSALPAADRVKVLTDLRASKQEIQWISAVTRGFDRALPELRLATREGPPSDRDLRSLVSTVGRLHVGPVLRLVGAQWGVDRVVGQGTPSAASLRSIYRRMLRIAFADPVEIGDLAVDGDDLRRVGIPAGPELGRILDALLQSVLEDPQRNRTDWLLQEAKRVYVAASRP